MDRNEKHGEESARIRALIRPGERLDDLKRGSLRILQRPDRFCFGMDSVLLASFAAQRRMGRMRGVDLGTGSGVLPLLICARVPGASFDAVEIQADMADMAARSMQICRMEHRIHVHAMDLRDAPSRLGHGRYDLVVSTPPYGKSGGGQPSRAQGLRTARHEGETDVQAICRTAAALLRNGGALAMVFPAPRLLELMDAMRAWRVEPKRVMLVHPAYGKAPNLALVEGVRNGRPMLHFLPPLFVRDGAGRETEALEQMYRQ